MEADARKLEQENIEELRLRANAEEIRASIAYVELAQQNQKEKEELDKCLLLTMEANISKLMEGEEVAKLRKKEQEEDAIRKKLVEEEELEKCCAADICKQLTAEAELAKLQQKEQEEEAIRTQFIEEELEKLRVANNLREKQVSEEASAKRRKCDLVELLQRQKQLQLGEFRERVLRELEDQEKQKHERLKEEQASARQKALEEEAQAEEIRARKLAEEKLLKELEHKIYTELQEKMARDARVGAVTKEIQELEDRLKALEGLSVGDQPAKGPVENKDHQPAKRPLEDKDCLIGDIDNKKTKFSASASIPSASADQQLVCVQQQPPAVLARLEALPNSMTHYDAWRRFGSKCIAKARLKMQMAQEFAKGGRAACAAFQVFLQAQSCLYNCFV